MIKNISKIVLAAIFPVLILSPITQVRATTNIYDSCGNAIGEPHLIDGTGPVLTGTSGADIICASVDGQIVYTGGDNSAHPDVINVVAPNVTVHADKGADSNPYPPDTAITAGSECNFACTNYIVLNVPCQTSCANDSAMGSDKAQVYGSVGRDSINSYWGSSAIDVAQGADDVFVNCGRYTYADNTCSGQVTSVSISGGSGDDVIQVTNVNLEVSVTLSGESGPDNMAISNQSPGAISTRATLNYNGDKGNDVLTSKVRHTTVNGGSGYDVCRVIHHVHTINCEVVKLISKG